MQLFGALEASLPTLRQTTPVCPSLRRDHCFNYLRSSAFLIIALVLISFPQTPSARSAPAAEIRVELPANGQLRVENQFGNISILVGSQKDILVSATWEPTNGSELPNSGAESSPVVIETRRGLLSISVVRPPGAQQIHLNLTLPANAKAEIVTGQGTILGRGLPSSLSLTTGSGAIQLNLEGTLDADIIARSTLGLVRSQIGPPGATDSHDYRSRFGAGTTVLRANSQSGDIFLNSRTGTSLPALAGRNEPELRPGEPALPAAGTPANQAAIEEVDEGDVVRVDSQLVTLNLSVVDRSTSRGLVGLTERDFRLYENDIEQKLVHFDSSSAPFDLVLVIDLSGSTRDVVRLIRAAARRFVDAARPSDRIAIITFAGQPIVVSPLTLDRQLLRQRVNAIDTAAGDTKLYDAGNFAMAEIARETKNSRRAAILMMSDGLDGSIEGVQGEGSRIPYAEFLNAIREFDGVLYTLWLNTYYEALNPQDTQPEAFDQGEDRMKEMADTGGGLYYEVESLEDLAGAYERVVADLGTVYSLAYRPLNKNRDGKWRAIRVNVSRTNAVARGKHGYYAN